MKKNTNNKVIKDNKNWKKENLAYLNEMQKFLDKASNIEPKELREEVINQMMKCDYELTKTVEREFERILKQEKKCLKK